MTETDERPLSGVRVLDLAVFIAAPYCAALLGDFGAEVVKVEMPGRGDSLRQLGSTMNGTSFYWRTMSRNKQTISVDLRKPEGQEIIRELCRQVDIVVENFRPGTLDRWGLGYESLKVDSPGLIMVSVSGYGQTGPLSPNAAVARTAMAFGGLTGLVGEPDGKPLLPGVAALADYLGGVYAAFGAMLALRHKERTGQGQQVDLALFEPVFHMLEDTVEAYDKLGQLRGRTGAENPNAAPHTHFRTREGSWIAIACSADELFVRLTRTMGKPELAQDPRFSDNQARIANRAVIEQIVQDWAEQRGETELVETLSQVGVPVSKLMTMADIFTDEHYAAREEVIRVMTDDVGELAMRGVIPRLTETPGRVGRPGGAIGRDNHEVLSRMLGLSDAEIEDLEAKSVI
jgi:crotonobetainyl-CoA:carnitine CoA-transferase CaiB-like acyl-CoA transferase